MKAFLVFLLLVALAVGGGAYYYKTQLANTTGPTFRTVTVTRGELIPTISATGTLEPEEVVDVGAQVVGRINSLGVDPSNPQKKKRIDYNSIVHEGTVLALIDDSVYTAQVDQAKAALVRSKADLGQMKAKLEQCKSEAERAKSLRPKKAISDSDYDVAIANYKTAQANVAVGEAQIKQNEAALKLAQTNLDYTIIKSPVEGVIIDRRVNVGQTVVSSLNAPSLFLIAKDLRHMQIWAAVNEADIGQIKPGMPVRFTVDTYPGEIFRGTVESIRLNATMTQNVVTYTVVIGTDNVENRLKPYQTANVLFEIDHRPDVLLVSNSALRWKPRPDLIAPDAKAASGKKGRKGGKKSSGKQASDVASKDSTDAKGDKEDKGSTKDKGTTAGKKSAEKGQLWVADGKYVRPISVQVGPTDTNLTEISGAGVKEGLEVITGEITAAERSSDVTNPFVPQMPRGGSKRSSSM